MATWSLIDQRGAAAPRCVICAGPAAAPGAWRHDQTGHAYCRAHFAELMRLAHAGHWPGAGVDGVFRPRAAGAAQ